MLKIALIVHNVRSAHNVGSILRSADGFGVETVYLTGYAPYPQKNNDNRLPHVARGADSKISKTALGAEKSVNWEQISDIWPLLSRLRSQGFIIAALEQTDESVNLVNLKPSQPIALIVGSEIDGIDKKILDAADTKVLIPMLGAKESFNVAVAAAVALYHLRWYNQTPDDRQNKNGFAQIRPSATLQAKRH